MNTVNHNIMSDTTKDAAWAPDRIWLQREQGEGGSHTWCEDSVGDGDLIEEVEYVRADRAQVQAEAVRATDAMRDVLAERQRQMSIEGWTPEHDDEHDMGEMAHAAAWYSIDQMMRNALDERGLSFWPWAQEWWKPTTPRRDLVKAGALILAEIERIDRATPGTCFFCSEPMNSAHESDCPQAPAPSTGDQS